MRAFILAVTGFGFIVIAACSSYGTSVVEVDEQAQVASVSVALPSPSLVAGQSQRGRVTVKDANGATLSGRPIVWFTSSASIASVTDSGVISAVTPGTATLSAVSEGVAGTAALTVIPRPPMPVAKVLVAINPAAIVVGQTARATVALQDSTGNPLTDRAVTWTSGSPSVATVSANGDISAVAPGTAAITAASEGKTASASLSVSTPAPVPVATVSVSPATASIQVGTTVQLSATTLDASGVPLTGRVIGWSSASPGVASVSSNGLVGAVSTGTAQIIASSEGKTSSATITVTAPAPIPVATVSVSPASASLLVGATAQLAATTRDANGAVLTGRSVSWSSANGSVASVNSNGLVSAASAGTAQITATSEGKTSSATITVTAPAPTPVASVTVSPSSSSPIVGATVQLSATTRDGSGNVLNGRVVTWSSANATIASVNSASGLVTAVALGSLQVTATSEGKTGTATINVQAPPPPGSTNEPTGMTLIDQRAFNSLTENAAPHSPAWDTDNTLSIVTDNTAPISAPNVIRATYNAGFTAGTSPGHAGFVHTGYKTLYIRFAFKLSANWVGNGSGTNKLMYEWTQNPANPAFFFSAHGTGSGPLLAQVNLQGIPVFPGGIGNLVPNLVPGAQIIRGQWHILEAVLTGNSAGTANGKIDWWLDGVHIGSYGNFQWTSVSTTFSMFEFRPVWGGVNTTPAISQAQTMDWDNVYLSGKN